MTTADAKELERLRWGESVNKRLKIRDARQREIDRTLNRRSGEWHQARTELAFDFIGDDVEDRISIRNELIARCPQLATDYETRQFEEQVSSRIEECFQTVLKGFPVTGVRPPVSILSQLATRKQALRHRIHAASRAMQLEAPTAAAPVPAPLPGATTTLTTEYRFQIALSFPGEARPRVQSVAELLATSIPRSAILYDQWLAAELARPNLDVYLTDLYKKDSLLLVFFLCGSYVEKEWCGLEWRIGRDLIKQRQEHRLMPLRLDDAEVPGFHSIDGYLDIRNLSDSQVANAILERLAVLTNRQYSQAVNPSGISDNAVPGPRAYRQLRRFPDERTASVGDLIPREIELLWTAVQAGELLHDTTNDGEALRAGDRQFLERADARTAAGWLGAFRSIEGRGFIEPLGSDRDFFRVTDRGYEAADYLEGFTRWNTHTIVLRAYDLKVPTREAVLSCTGIVAIPALYYPDQTGMDGSVARSLKERRSLLVEGADKSAFPSWQPTDVEFTDESTGLTEQFRVEGFEVIRAGCLKLPLAE